MLDQITLPYLLTVFVFIIKSWKETNYGNKDQRRTKGNIGSNVQCL